ncbi:MAG: 1,2-phenylacetyl-CoA epoxidase subunit PaaD [Betaproteobacteria bacterium]
MSAAMLATGAGVAAGVAAAVSSPSLGVFWIALASVPDPEIPAVSVVELGIVRRVAWDVGDPSTLVVTVTPTYSGCPATELIATSIRDALTACGVGRVRIDTQLAPAWTTDWITPEGRRKLREFGIAPPDGSRAVSTASPIDVAGISPLRRSTVVVPCPRCNSPQTRLVSQFGSTACKAHYRCLECLEPFDYFKPH